MSLLGIAILPGHIHIIELKNGRNSYRLKRACHERLPLEIFENGKIISFDLLTQTLKEIVKRERMVGMQAAVCLPVEFALIQRMRMPLGLSSEEVAAEIAVEVQKHAMTRREKMTMDYQLLPQRMNEQMEVMFAVTEEEYVWKYHASLAAAGVKLAIMELDALALQRALPSQLDKSAMLYMLDHAVFFAVMDDEGNLIYRRWNQQISRQEWLQQCAKLCEQMKITSVAVSHDATEISIDEINSLFSLHVYVVDPFSEIDDKYLTNITCHRSAFLLAYGLALRSPLPWLN